MATKPEHVKMLEDWMKSYRPDELFDDHGKLDSRVGRARPERRAPHGRESACQRRPAVEGPAHAGFPRLRRGCSEARDGDRAEATRVLGKMLRDVMKMNAGSHNFRVFGPDETSSNRLDALFEVTNRKSDGEHSSRPTITSRPDGRVMEVLSEHMCQGWLEGYLLTGRHGFFSCYEAFIHIVDSMFNQHAKWLKESTRDSLAAAHRFAELSADVARLAAGSQRIQPSGSRLHRSTW